MAEDVATRRRTGFSKLLVRAVTLCADFADTRVFGQIVDQDDGEAGQEFPSVISSDFTSSSAAAAVSAIMVAQISLGILGLSCGRPGWISSRARI